MHSDELEREFESFAAFPLEAAGKEVDLVQLLETIRQLPGITSADIVEGELQVAFIPETIDSKYLLDRLVDWGVCRPFEPEKKTSWISRVLASLAKSNSATFGQAPLDCCRLNRKN